MLSESPHVTVLGPVRVGGEDPGGPLARALLASLALAEAVGDRVRSAGALADDIWGEDRPQNPRAALQSLVSRVRALDGEGAIATLTGGYALASAGDLALAGRLVERGERARGAEGVALLDQALALWRGAPAEDLGSAPVAQDLLEASEALRSRLHRLRARALRDAGRAEEAARELRPLLEGAPFDELLCEELMQVLAAGGRASEALALYAGFRERLRDELGSSPGGALVELNARLLREQEAALATPLRIGVVTGSDELVGREDDLGAVSATLRDHRIVTILGTGGLGKTRLAQAVAAASREPLVVVVPLAGVRADGDVQPAIAAALGISETQAPARLSESRARPDLRQRLIAVLGERPTLLVLDNCEQVVGGVAGWVADALASMPGLRVLTTSRSPLGLAAEASYPLAPLPVGSEAEAGAAVRLFLQRARAVRPSARLPLDVVSRLCERLDGLPLAIELAAARVRTMTPEQIEARLEDRFGLLTGGDPSAPARHRTLEAVIGWSWDLLEGDTRSALAILSVLPGGFSAETAASILGEEADELLDRLVSQSLLTVADDEASGGVRFRMLETVREFGFSRLRGEGLEDAAWESVTAWGRGFVLQRSPRAFGLPGSLGPEQFRAIRAEQENLLAVLRHAIASGEAEESVLIFGLLAQSWVVRGAHTELGGIAAELAAVLLERTAGRGAVRPTELVPADAQALALAFCAVALAAADDTRSRRAVALLRRLGRDAASELRPLWRAIASLVGTVNDGALLFSELARLEASDDPETHLLGSLVASMLAENGGEPQRAIASAKLTWRLAVELDEQWIAAMAANGVAELESQSAHPSEALDWLERAGRGFAAFDAENELGERGWLRGMALVSLGRHEEARPIFEELTRVVSLPPGGREFASIGWYGLAEVQRAAGEAEEAMGSLDRALLELHARGQRASPWYIMVLAGIVSAACFDSSLPPGEIARRAARLRGRALALQRLQPRFVDHPVLGTVLTGWSAWAITVPELRQRGLLALALAEALGARQDQPSLRLDPHWARAEALLGAEAVREAKRVAAAMDPDARVPRALDTLAAPVPSPAAGRSQRRRP